jgi:hypothetical protein
MEIQQIKHLMSTQIIHYALYIYRQEIFEMDVPLLNAIYNLFISK